MRIRGYLIILIYLWSYVTFAQHTYIPYQYDLYQSIERAEIKSGACSNELHTGLKPYATSSFNNFYDTLGLDSLKQKAHYQLTILYQSNWELNEKYPSSKKAFLKYFYNNPYDFYSVNEKNFQLHVNPQLYFSLGNAAGNSQNTFLNTRGIEIKGRIAQRLGFYTSFSDNQARFANYVNNKIDYYTNDTSSTPVVPYEAFAKTFKDNGYDFITARGYITFELIKKYVDLQFGYDKNFIGNGFRSLILSDQAAPYTFLKLNTHIWKFHYQNIFAQMNGSVTSATNLYPKKFAAIHHLSLNIGKHVNIGVFESIIFGRADSTQNGSFDIAYLNPIIFYRSIEQSNGSYDNSTLGLDFKIIALKSVSFYGQLILDEFVLSEIKANKGWWGNKYGIQLGVKYIDVAKIKNLDLQLETNIVRPYTYSHEDNYRSYSHYNQPLAHPMGANFKEGLAIIKYQPYKKLTFTSKSIYTIWGDDSTTTQNNLNNNNGGNILKSYLPVAQANTYNNSITQGIKNNILFLSLQASYQLKPNFFVEATYIFRKQSSDWPLKNLTTNYIALGIRWNIIPRNYEF
jgi:hypothetical protein